MFASNRSYYRYFLGIFVGTIATIGTNESCLYFLGPTIGACKCLRHFSTFSYAVNRPGQVFDDKEHQQTWENLALDVLQKCKNDDEPIKQEDTRSLSHQQYPLERRLELKQPLVTQPESTHLHSHITNASC